MGKYSKIPISTFLLERDGRYKPHDAKIKNLKRLDKIDFSGNIHLSQKPTKTDMIIVQPGDLVISGINVAKGAIAVYEGKEPITATIHYSSYIFDNKKIEISYLKRFLKSPIFIQELQDQVKGGIKTEIKAKHLLPIVIDLPDITTQQKINSYFKSFENELTELNSETGKQNEFLSLLRQSILQEAIDGKLTAEWRKKNSLNHELTRINTNKKKDIRVHSSSFVVTDLEYAPASVLLEHIKAEKQKLIAEGKIRKEKPLAPIKPEEVPFELPEGWVWCKLGEIADSCLGKMLDAHKNKGRPYPYLRNLNVRWFDFDLSDLKQIKVQNHELVKCSAQKGDLLICEGGYPGRGAIWNSDESIVIQKAIHRVRFFIKKHNIWFLYFLSLLNMNRDIEQYFTGSGIQHLTGEKLKTIVIPLPPLAEQRTIVESVDKLLAIIEELEKQVTERKGQTQDLMQTVLREAFEG